MAIEDNASIALIPSGYKSGKLYSVIPESGNGDFTHSRGSTATRLAASGLIETVPSGVPRLDYPLIDGVVQDCPALLLEPSRTNYLQRTEEFDNSYWSKYSTSVTANQTTAPNGSNSADKLIENTSTTQHEIGRSFGFTSGTTYVASVFAKTNGRNLQIRGGNTNTWPGNANFDLVNGLVQSVSLGTAYIENYGNGWYRCTVKATAAASSNTNVNFRLVEGSASTYTGDGSSGVFLWGAQNEIGLYPTSYIPWDGSGTTTRSADVCGGSGTSADFNSAEGVLFAEMANLSNDGVEKRLGLQDSGTYETVRITYVPTANRITGVVYNGANQCVLNYDAPDTTDFNKIALKYKVNDFALWVNGFEVGTDPNGSTFDANQLDELAFDVNNGARVYAKTKQLMTFKTALSDSDLETLTSWDSFTAMAKGQQYTIE